MSFCTSDALCHSPGSDRCSIPNDTRERSSKIWRLFEKTFNWIKLEFEFEARHCSILWGEGEYLKSRFSLPVSRRSAMRHKHLNQSDVIRFICYWRLVWPIWNSKYITLIQVHYLSGIFEGTLAFRSVIQRSQRSLPVYELASFLMIQRSSQNFGDPLLDCCVRNSDPNWDSPDSRWAMRRSTSLSTTIDLCAANFTVILRCQKKRPKR
jgi:hypothetical protein